MSTDQAYDVLFVSRRQGVSPEITGTIAQNVDRETAVRLASSYSHRNEADEGVMIACHGTTRAPQGSEWWFEQP